MHSPKDLAGFINKLVEPFFFATVYIPDIQAERVQQAKDVKVKPYLTCVDLCYMMLVSPFVAVV